MLEEELTTHSQKKAKCSMIVWGITYLFLFPFLFFRLGLFFVLNIFNGSLLNTLIGFVSISPIIAMPLAFLLMWYSYSKSYFKVTRLCWTIPIFFFVFALLTHIILNALHATTT